MKEVSLKTIAEEVGVSIATVSLVLNGKDKNGRISKKVANKILSIASEYNYIPNSIAKSLKVGKSKTIGLIVADISNMFFGKLALHIQNHAEKAGYTIIVGNTNENLFELKKMINLLKSRQVDGLIITPTGESESLFQELLPKQLPFVFVDRDFPMLNSNAVLINNYEISYTSTKLLLKKGCKRVAMITYKNPQYHMDERKRGYIDALKEQNFFVESLIKYVRYEHLEEDVYVAIKELFTQDSFDGVFFTTNSISMKALKHIVKLKKDKMGDLKYVCFDQNDAYCLLPIDIAYITQPIEEMAKAAVDIIINQIENQNEEKKKVVVCSKISHKEY